MAFIVGGLLVLVAIIAVVFFTGGIPGGAEDKGDTNVDVNIDVPKMEMPDLPQIEPPTLPSPEPAPAN